MSTTSKGHLAGRVWTLSNALSASRVLLVYPIVRSLLAGDRSTAALLILLAAATDFLDGLLARRLGQISDVGKVIDPLADKVGIGAVAAALVVTGDVPVWFLLVAVARDLLILAGGIYVQRTRGTVLQSTWTGKWAAGATAAYLLVAMLGEPSLAGVTPILLAVACALLAASTIIYVRRFAAVVAAAPPPLF